MFLLKKYMYKDARDAAVELLLIVLFAVSALMMTSRPSEVRAEEQGASRPASAPAVNAQSDETTP